MNDREDRSDPPLSFIELKQNKELSSFNLDRYSLKQQNVLVISVFLIRLGCRDILKNIQNKTTKRFSLGNTKVNILALTAVSKSKIRLTSYTKLALIG